MIASGVCIVAAAVFLLLGNLNAAFVTAVLGLVAWFLNYRAQVQDSLAAEAEDELDDQDGQNGMDNSDDYQDSED